MLWFHYAVAFPFLEPILLRIVPYLEVGQSVKFLHKSASSIINARKEQAAVVSKIRLQAEYVVCPF